MSAYWIFGPPEMDGNKLARRLKAKEKTSSTLLTGLKGYSKSRIGLKPQWQALISFREPLDPNHMASLLTRHQA